MAFTSMHGALIRLTGSPRAGPAVQIVTHTYEAERIFPPVGGMFATNEKPRGSAPCLGDCLDHSPHITVLR